MPLQIRSEQPSDSDAIEALTIAAFRDAPHSSHTEQFIVRELRAAGALSLSLVAEEHGAILGHVALSPITISTGASGWFGLGPISVAPAHQNRGIGTQLMRATLDTLREQGAAGCVLLGDPAYYSRFGFQPEPDLVLPGVPPEYFQALSFGQPLPQGIVTYHQAFSAQS